MTWARDATSSDADGPLSAREMSRLAGLSESMWGLLEAGEKTGPSAKTMVSIATLLGVTTDWIIARRGPDPSEESVRAAVERARAGHDAPPADAATPPEAA